MAFLQVGVRMDQRDFATVSPSTIDPRSTDFVDHFGAFLLAEAFLDELAVRRAQRGQRQTGERFDLVIMRLGLMPDAAMAEALSRYCSLRLVTFKDLPTEPLDTVVLDPAFLRSSRIIPVSDDGDSVLLAAADPFNSEASSSIAYLIERPIEMCIAAEGDILRAIDALYGQQSATSKIAASPAATTAEVSSEDDVQRLADMASEAPVIRFVQDLIVRAANEQASDIHIEPREDCVRVRIRLDGVLHMIETLPLSMRAAVGSRVKIMARLNIAERRLPQDGRIKVNVRGREIDLRVSTMPTLWGESIVLRLLDRSNIELDFPQLGFAGRSYGELNTLLRQPNGIILVTGPTGSGKTTTLYTALSDLNSTERKLFTVEDPIEYQLAGVNQIQVQPKIGLTFATALRSILRQDPDIIMVGEIRDLETAQIAIQASLTGHLVLSTVHTNSAAATLTRLADMGVEKYLLASTVKGVLGQRLVRKLCSGCATSATATEVQQIMSLLRSTGVTPETLLNEEEPRLRKAVGCKSCRQTGFSGRTTIYELLTTTPHVTEAILSGQSEAEIQRVGMAQGMTTMLQSGLVKALKGETTPEEVMRVTRFDTCLSSDTEPTTNAAR